MVLWVKRQKSLLFIRIKRGECCRIFDHTLKLQDCGNKVYLESGGRTSNQMTKLAKENTEDLGVQ